MATFTADQILAELDDAAKPYGDYAFPMLDHGYYYPVDQRLHAYGDETRWAILIEAMGYNPRAGNLIDVIHKLGNCVKSRGYEDADFLSRLDPDNARELNSIALDDNDWSRVDGVKSRGRKFAIPADAGKGTELWDVLREIVPEDRLWFLATEDELRARVPADLPLLLTLDEWNHPDVLGDVQPSSTETFKQIADVLVSGDPGKYAPTVAPNTHWKNWPLGGSL